MANKSLEDVVTIRPSKMNDLTQLMPLLNQLGYPQSLDELKKQYEIFISQKDYGIAVAERENKIVGWVAWSKNIAFVLPMVRIRIEGLVVDESCRGQGIGKALMRYVENFALQCRPCIIELTSGLRRKKDGSHEFYKSLGYKNEGPIAKLYLRKTL